MRLALLLVLAVPSACGVKPTDPFAFDGADGGQVDSADAGAVEGGLAAGCARCEAWNIPVVAAGTLEDVAINELSGLGASRKNPGVLYGNNDSGDSARFFAISSTGARLGRFSLRGVPARDWEELAVGPCPAGSCVFLADIGDNRSVRSDYAIYRVSEPQVGPDDLGEKDVAFDRFPFEYPGGAHFNAETLLVHPVTGEVFVVTKHEAGVASTVYRFPKPMTADVSVTLEKIAQLQVPAAGDLSLTAGSFSPCGDALLLRMYNRLVELRLPAGAREWNAIFTAAPFRVAVATEQQGEAVTYSADGRAYFTASEGTAQTLSRVDCAR